MKQFDNYALQYREIHEQSPPPAGWRVCVGLLPDGAQ